MRAALLSALVLLVVGASPATASGKESLAQSGYKTLRYDVAMDGGSFHFEGPTNDAGYPADGTPFITVPAACPSLLGCKLPNSSFIWPTKAL